MLRRSKLLISFTVLAVCFGLGFSQRVNADSGISLSPFQQIVNLNSSTPSASYNLTITNNTSSLKEIDLSVKDFGSLNNTGGVLLEGANSYTERYGLASWMSLGTDTVNLGPDQSAQVPVSIINRQDLQPGGHYGAIIASINSLNSQSGNQVTVNQDIISLIIADKTGGEHFALNLTKISQNGNWVHYPNTVELEFQNPGNVQVTPRGIVDLESPSGTIIARGIINQGSAFILSDSFYDMYVPLQKVGSSYPTPGLYKIVVSYRYDQISGYATKVVYLNFIDLGMYLVIGGLIIIAIIVLKIHKKRRSQNSKNTD